MNSRHSEQGLTLVETTAAMLIFLGAVAFMLPMFTNQQLSTIKNEIETGAISVSQQILDQIRQTDVASLPNSGTHTTLPSGTSIATVSKLGKQYSATVIYCANAPNPNCNANARHITVQVNYNGQSVYTVETVYTRLQ